MDEIKVIILDNFGMIFTSLFGSGALVAYVMEKKKNKALTNQEVAKASQEDATAVTLMRIAYKEFTEDMNQKYETLIEEVKDLKKKLTDVSSELDQEKVKYSKLKTAYDNLKKEFDNYKKKHNNA